MKILKTLLCLLVFCGAVGTGPKDSDAKSCCGCEKSSEKTEVKSPEVEPETEV